MLAYMMGNMVKSALSKGIDWVNDTIKVKLLASTVAPNQDTWVYADISPGNSGVEVTGTGYTSGGAAISNKTSVYDAVTNQLTLDGADVSWGPGATIANARYALIYDDTPSANKPILGYVDFQADQSCSNGTFTIKWDASGIFDITVS
jgi:hypothetical protein